MKSERGFVTIFALCLILVVALVAKGIHESDTNHNYATADLQTQFDLQNAADGGIYEAAEIVRAMTEYGEELLPANNFNSPSTRRENQVQLVTNNTVKTLHGTIHVDVWGERLKIQDFVQRYPRDKYKPESVKDSNGKDVIRYGYALISVAELDSPTFGKMYRRAFAFVVDGYGVTDLNEIVNQPVADKDKDVVHFMTLP